MTAEQAIAFGNLEKLLFFDEIEQPLILQVGGSTPHLMANAIKIAQEKNELIKVKF